MTAKLNRVTILSPTSLRDQDDHFVQWRADSITGKIKSALVESGLADYVKWYAPIYNDKGGWYGEGNRRIKWQYAIRKTFPPAKRAKLERILRRTIKMTSLVAQSRKKNDYFAGTLYVCAKA